MLFLKINANGVRICVVLPKKGGRESKRRRGHFEKTFGIDKFDYISINPPILKKNGTNFAFEVLDIIRN